MGINTAYDLLPLKENFSPQKLINYNLQENLHQHNDGKIIIDYSNFKVKQEKKHNSHIIEETVDFTYYPWSSFDRENATPTKQLMLSAKKKIDDNNYNFKNEVENDETNSEIGEITIVID